MAGLVGKRLMGAKILVLPDEPFATGGNCIYFWRDSLQIPTADFENTGGRSIQLFQIDDPSHAQKQRLSQSTKMVSRFRTARSAARMRVDFREMSSIHFSPEALARAPNSFDGSLSASKFCGCGLRKRSLEKSPRARSTDAAETFRRQEIAGNGSPRRTFTRTS